MRRANIGCGSVQPKGWDNFDGDHQYAGPYCRYLKLPFAETPLWRDYDYIVASFMLQEFNHHDIPAALESLRAMLKRDGVLRVLVPNVLEAINAYYHEDEEWFPQDDRTGDLDAKFCSFVTWYGTVRSVFTADYLERLLGSVFSLVQRCDYGHSFFLEDGGITELDSRPKEALIFEARP